MTVNKLARLPFLCAATLLIFSRCLTAASAQTAPPTSLTQPANSATNPLPLVIPFQALPCHGGPVLPVAIGEHSGQHFLVDTGTPGTYIGTDAAKRLGLKIEPYRKDGKVVAYGGKPYVGFNGTLLIGDIKMPSFFPTDQGNLQSLFDFGDDAERRVGSDTRLGGVVGTNVLGYYAVEIDPIRQEIRLYQGEMTDERLKQIGFSGGAASGVALNFDYSRQEVPSVMVDVSAEKSGTSGTVEAKPQQVSLPMLIDTGAYQTAIGSEAASLFAGVTEAPRPSRYENLPFHLYDGVSLRVGSATLNHFTCDVIDKNAPATPQYAARLGMNFLAHFHVLLDFPGKRLYLEPIDLQANISNNPTLQANQMRNVDNMIVEPMAAGVWTVRAAASDSRFARSGMKPGDKIVAVDGTALSGKSPQAVEFLLSRAQAADFQRQGKQVHTLLAGAENADANAAQTAVIVPMTLHKGLIWLDGAINDKPAHLVLDTGATNTIVPSRTVDNFGLTRTKVRDTLHGSGGDVSVQEANNLSINMGGLLFTGGNAYVVNLPEFLQGRDAIIGSTIFQHLVTVVDYDHHLCGFGFNAAPVIAAITEAATSGKSVLEPPESMTAVAAAISTKPTTAWPSATSPAPIVSLPMTLDADGYIGIQGSIDGHPICLHIDSGDGGSVTMFASYVDRHHLRSQFKKSIQIETGRGIGGIIHGDVVRLHTLILGEGDNPTKTIRLHSVVAELSSQTNGYFKSDYADGQIGAEVLKRFLVVFDYPHSRLLLIRNRHLDDPFIYDRVGFGIDEMGGEYVALGVLTTGPAAHAGIRNGDVIISVDGVPVKKIMEAEDDVYEKSTQPVGTIIRVVYQRGKEKPVEVKLTLRELLP